MFQALLARIAETLERHELPYMVIGGQAVLQYGEPRLTRDIDVTLGVDTDRLDELLLACGEMELTPLVDPRKFTIETMVLPCAASNGLRVDFIFSFSAFEADAIARSRSIVIGGAAVQFVCPEDLVIQKLIAGRPRDIDDARTVLAKQPALDRAAVGRILAEFELALGRPLLAAWDLLLHENNGADPIDPSHPDTTYN